MLLELKVRNWASFKDEVTFNILATAEEQHSDHLIDVPEMKYKALPIAMLYGGNASGKTNLIKALAFLQNLVRAGIDIDGDVSTPIKTNSFMFNEESRDKPSMIAVTFLSNERVYEYEVEFGSTIYTEKLTIISPNKDESQVVFYRQKDEFIVCPLFANMDVLNQFLRVRPTQLILNAAQSFATYIYPIKDAFDWFTSLVCVFPHQTVSQFVHAENFDISGIVSELNILPPEKLKQFSFECSLESSGTQHILDLVPAIMALSKENSNLVLIMDEFDRNLHPLMSMKLVSMFLDKRKQNTKSQLIATCHNPLILDQSILRRDEIWLLDRDKNGVSNLSSVSDFMDVDDDSDILYLYILGKLGGVPLI